MPSVSLIICTRNRAKQLEDCLRAVERIDDDDWELVVVDNGSSDHTQDVIAEARGRMSLVSVVEPVPGLSRARNAGVRASRGPIVAFTDDDCYPEPDFVAATRVIFDDPRTGAGGGRVLLHDPDDWPITFQPLSERVEFPPRSFIGAGAIHGANMAFRRDVLEAIGGFDERLGAGTHYPAEDVDAQARVLWGGWSIVYDPRPTVRHHHGRRTRAEFDRLMHGYSRGRGAYYAKFIVRRDSRRTYVLQWLRSWKHELVVNRSARQPVTELVYGLRYLLRL